MSITVTPLIKSFLVSFSPSQELDISGYKVFGVQTDAADFTPNGDNKGDGNCLEEGTETSYLIPVSAGGRWLIKVAAYDTFGEDVLNYSQPLEVLVATTDPLDQVAPGIPAEVTAASGLTGSGVETSAYLTLSWTLTEPDDFSNYLVRYRVAGQTAWTEVSTSEPTCTIGSLVPGVAYQYQVAAVDRWGNASDWSELASSAVATDAVAPAAVSDLTAAPGFGSVRLSWTDPTDSDYAAMEIYRNTSDESSTATPIGKSPGGGFSDTALTTGATYYYWTKSVDFSGNRSAFSNGASATTILLAVEDLATDAAVDFVLSGAIFSFDAGSSTTLRWTSGSIVRDGISYALAAGSLPTAHYSYIIASLSGASATLSTSPIGSALPALSADQVIIALTSVAPAAYADTSKNAYLCYVREANSLQIEGAMIRNETVENSKIKSLVASKITSDNLDVNEYIGVNNGQLKLGKIGTGENGILLRNAANTADVFKVSSSGDATLKNVAVDGTVAVGGTVASPNLFLDGTNKRITVNDGTRDRVQMGQLGTGDYGIDIKDADGNSVVKVSNSAGAAIQNATVGNLVVGPEGITCGTPTSAFKVWEAVDGRTNLLLGDYGNGDTSYLHWDGDSLNLKADVEMGPNSSISWQQVADKPEPRGAWSSTYGSYIKGDTVFHNNSSYVCILGHTAVVGKEPTNATYWSLLAAAGYDGYNTSTVTIYKRSATAPALPTTAGTYTFSTAAITGLDNGWTKNIPAGTDDLYAAVATAVSRTDFDEIAANEWSTPTILSTVGVDGAPGLNSATVYLFQRTATSTAPSEPASSLTYHFTTGVLDAPLGSWSQTLPTSGGAYRWMTTATAASTASTDTILSTEWATPAILANDGATGPTGNPGQGQVKGVSFLRSLAAPATPTGGTFAAPNATGWSDGIPADNNQPLWMTSRIFTSDGLAPQQAAWTTPAKIGTPSTGTKTQFSIDGSTLWHDVPAISDQYMRTGTSTDNGATWTYSGAMKIKGETGATGSQGPQGIQGATGAAGVNAVTVALSNDAHTVPAAADGTVSSYTGSGTDIIVYELTTAMSYVTSLTGPSQFTVAAAVSGITCGAISAGTGKAVVAQHSAMTTNPASITYTITARRADNTTITITKKQTITKSVTGATGATGATGSQGIQGPQGPAGDPTYTWLKYADTPTTGMSDSPTGKTYMGLAYNKTTPTESTNYADYSWSLIKGEQGVQGPTGPTGAATYTWIKYANDAVGTGMSDSPAGKTYIGIAYNKSTAVESSVAGDYAWSLIQGEAGADSSSYWLTASPDKIINNEGVFSPTSVMFTANTKTGAGAPGVYAGRFKIYQNGSLTYTSSANESSKAVTPIANALTIKCEMFLAGGVTSKLDEQTVLVLVDLSQDVLDAQNTANTAAANALTAKAITDDITSDDKLSAAEKQSFKPLFDGWVAEQSGIDTQATALGITTEKTAYDTALSTLVTYCNTTKAIFTNLTTTTDLGTGGGAVLRGHVSTMTTAKQALLNKLASVASTMANSRDGNVTSIPRPLGGSYSYDGSVTGAIKISLPVLKSSTVIQFRVEVYNYATGTSFTAIIGGYNYTIDWLQTSASIVGSSAANHTIRFGDDGSKNCVLIGEIDTVWSSPKVVVKDLIVGYGGTQSIDAWKSGWAVSVVTVLPSTINVTDTDNLVHASDVNKVAGVLAATVKDNAANALANAATANNALADIASDAKLTPSEKSFVRKEWDAIYGEYTQLYSQADALGVSRTDYVTKTQALGTYLNAPNGAYAIGATPPFWITDAQLPITTPIVGATFRSTFKAYYDAKIALMNAIAAKAATMATWASVGGTGKPKDNAGKVLDTRNDNQPPVWYPVGTTDEFKFCSVIGVSDPAMYGALQTVKPYGDSSGGAATQYFMTGSKTYKRTGSCGDSVWGAWVLDLDRNSYTGALNADVTADTLTAKGIPLNTATGGFQMGDNAFIKTAGKAVDGTGTGLLYGTNSAGKTIFNVGTGGHGSATPHISWNEQLAELEIRGKLHATDIMASNFVAQTANIGTAQVKTLQVEDGAIFAPWIGDSPTAKINTAGFMHSEDIIQSIVVDSYLTGRPMIVDGSYSVSFKPAAGTPVAVIAFLTLYNTSTMDIVAGTIDYASYLPVFNYTSGAYTKRACGAIIGIGANGFPVAGEYAVRAMWVAINSSGQFMTLAADVATSWALARVSGGKR